MAVKGEININSVIIFEWICIFHRAFIGICEQAENHTFPNKIVTSSHRGWYHSATTEEKLGNLATRDVKPKNIFPPAQENSSWYMTVCNFNLRYASVASPRPPKLIKRYHHLTQFLVWDTCFRPLLISNNQLVSVLTSMTQLSLKTEERKCIPTIDKVIFRTSGSSPLPPPSSPPVGRASPTADILTYPLRF